MKLTLLPLTQIKEAWDNAFDKPVNLDRRLTADDILTVRLTAVVQAQLAHTKKELGI